MDAVVGSGNWYCFPDRRDAVGVKNLASSFVVQPPIAFIDISSGKYTIGQVVPYGGGATAYLVGSFPTSECPLGQLKALAEWISKSNQPATRALIDSLLGKGNWYCPDVPYAVNVVRVPGNWIVQYPFTAASYNSLNYGLGEALAGGGTATLWMLPLPKSECP